MLGDAPNNPPRILGISRDDYQPLLEALNAHWRAIPFEGIHFPEHGKSGANVILLRDHVVKAQGNPWDLHGFKREHRVLLGLTREVAQRGVSATSFLGVDVPQITTPEHNHDIAMFVMSRLRGETLWAVPEFAHENWVMDKLARFFFEIDKVGANQFPNARIKNPETTDTARGKAPLPDFAKGLSQILPYALVTTEKPSPVRPRYVHYDLNPGNILVEAGMQEVGIADFGQVYYGDPHFALAKFLVGRMAIYGERGINPALRMIDRINDLSYPEPWADIERCVLLAPIVLANALQRYTGEPITQEVRDRYERAIEGIRKLFITDVYELPELPKKGEQQQPRHAEKDELVTRKIEPTHPAFLRPQDIESYLADLPWEKARNIQVSVDPESSGRYDGTVKLGISGKSNGIDLFSYSINQQGEIVELHSNHTSDNFRELIAPLRLAMPEVHRFLSVQFGPTTDARIAPNTLYPWAKKHVYVTWSALEELLYSQYENNKNPLHEHFGEALNIFGTRDTSNKIYKFRRESLMQFVKGDCTSILQDIAESESHTFTGKVKIADDLFHLWRQFRPIIDVVDPITQDELKAREALEVMLRAASSRAWEDYNIFSFRVNPSEDLKAPGRYTDEDRNISYRINLRAEETNANPRVRNEFEELKREILLHEFGHGGQFRRGLNTGMIVGQRVKHQSLDLNLVSDSDLFPGLNKPFVRAIRHLLDSANSIVEAYAVAFSIMAAKRVLQKGIKAPSNIGDRLAYSYYERWLERRPEEALHSMQTDRKFVRDWGLKPTPEPLATHLAERFGKLLQYYFPPETAEPALQATAKRPRAQKQPQKPPRSPN